MPVRSDNGDDHCRPGKRYLVFDRKPLNPSNSKGFSRFCCVEEWSAEAEIEARRTEILGWRPKSEEIFALDRAPDLWEKNLRCIPKTGYPYKCGSASTTGVSGIFRSRNRWIPCQIAHPVLFRPENRGIQAAGRPAEPLRGSFQPAVLAPHLCGYPARFFCSR